MVAVLYTHNMDSVAPKALENFAIWSFQKGKIAPQARKIFRDFEPYLKGKNIQNWPTGLEKGANTVTPRKF